MVDVARAIGGTPKNYSPWAGVNTTRLPYFARGPVYQGDAAMQKPRHWRTPRAVFVCPSSDLFHEDIPQQGPEPNAMDVIDVMLQTPQHVYLVLTKRAERMADSLLRLPHPENGLSHVWLGVSVCTQAEADAKLSHLAALAAAGWNTWASFEPMIGPVEFSGAWDEWWESAGLRWVVLGCESGPKRRTCDELWLRDAIWECDATGVPCYVKPIQLGPDRRVSRDPAEWPSDLRVRQLPDFGGRSKR